MVIKQFTQGDIPFFLDLAASEGWISSEWELEFLLGSFPEGCFSCVNGARPVAFVTSIKYDKSGWIGNLIVAETLRGREIGSGLMRKAMEALLKAGAETVWLTASDSGKPIYERLGFAEIDAVKRWKGRGRGGCARRICEITVPEAVGLDLLGWGDERNSLVLAACGRGEMFATMEGFLVLQDCGNFKQVGPWGSVEAGDASLLLDEVLTRVESSSGIALDVPEGNSHAAPLLASRGFTVTGRTCLMYFGVEPLYKPDKIYALGSMGSMG